MGRRKRKHDEATIREVLRVFHEFILDCEADIEGCSGEELTEIQHALTTARELRRRTVGYLIGDHDVRGVPLTEARHG